MYRISSGSTLDVSPVRVFTAIAFQSETTAGSSEASVTGALVPAKLAAGMAMPMARTAAAASTPHVLGRGRNRRGTRPGGIAPSAFISDTFMFRSVVTSFGWQDPACSVGYNRVHPCRSRAGQRRVVGVAGQEQGTPEFTGNAAVAGGAAVKMRLGPGQRRQPCRSGPGARAPAGQPLPAASAVTGDVGRRLPRPAHTEGDCAAPRAFAPNHAITGSDAAAPPQAPKPRISDRITNPRERNDLVVSGKTLPRAMWEYKVRTH